MAMVSMKMEHQDMPQVQENPYGYGLCICLYEEQVEALGLDKNPPAAGSTVGIQAIAVVRRKSETADPGDEDGDVDVVLELQITDMEVSAPVEARVASDKLYGGE